MLTTEPSDVALLALIYREQYLARREDLDSVKTDFETCPGEVSWLTLLGVDRLTERDWEVLRALATPHDFLALARRSDPLRAEALMHACPPNGRCSERAWTTPYRGARWLCVQSRMRQFELEGYTATRDDLHAVVASAWQAATGGTFEDYLDAWA